MLQQTKDFHDCAVCEFWQGLRRLDERCQHVSIPPFGEGRCTLHDGPYSHLIVNASGACPKWQAWHSLI